MSIWCFHPGRSRAWHDTSWLKGIKCHVKFDWRHFLRVTSSEKGLAGKADISARKLRRSPVYSIPGHGELCDFTSCLRGPVRIWTFNPLAYKFRSLSTLTFGHLKFVFEIAYRPNWFTVAVLDLTGTCSYRLPVATCYLPKSKEQRFLLKLLVIFFRLQGAHTFSAEWKNMINPEVKKSKIPKLQTRNWPIWKTICSQNAHSHYHAIVQNHVGWLSYQKFSIYT